MRESTNFKTKQHLAFTLQNFLYKFFPIERRAIFGFWAVQTLKLRRNTCSPVFDSSLALNSHQQNLKGWPSQTCELQPFCFQNVPIWQRLLANQLGGFEYNFRCLKWFFRKLPRKLRSAFFLKLRFLKIPLLVTWLKCLPQIEIFST